MAIKPSIIILDAISCHQNHKYPGIIFSVLYLALTQLSIDLHNYLLVTYYVLGTVQDSGDIMMYEAYSLPSKSSSKEKENLKNFQNNKKYNGNKEQSHLAALFA